MKWSFRYNSNSGCNETSFRAFGKDRPAGGADWPANDRSDRSEGCSSSGDPGLRGRSAVYAKRTNRVKYTSTATVLVTF